MAMRFTNLILAGLSASLLLAACGGGADTVSTVNNPPSVTVSVADAPASDEGSALVFSISLSVAQSQAVIVGYTTRDGLAVAGADYAANSGTVTIDASSTSVDVSVSTSDDSTDEPDETVFLDITSVSIGAVGTSTASGIITDNDASPTLSIADSSASEGSSGQAPMSFSVSLSEISGFVVSADFSTTDGSANAGSDYVAANGAVSIPAGSLTTTVDVQVTGDTNEEANETFTVTLSNAASATLGDSSATGTIINDDGAGRRRIAQRPAPSSTTIRASRLA